VLGWEAGCENLNGRCSLQFGCEGGRVFYKNHGACSGVGQECESEAMCAQLSRTGQSDGPGVGCEERSRLAL